MNMKMMEKKDRNKSQRGAALFIVLLALLLLTAIGIGFMFMADTENSVNNNYRDSQKAYFASRAGLENVRLLLAPGGSLNAPALALDGNMPTTSNTAGILYVLNPTGSEAVNPSSGTYLDDELCQEQYTSAGTYPFGTATPGTRCSAPSTGFTTTTLTTTDIPYTGTSGALPFKWVRITNKQNLMGSLGGSSASATYTVDGSTNYGYQVCYDGTSEVPISGGRCQDATPNPLMPVWLLTSLAVTPQLGSVPGSRRITQMELAFAPPIQVNVPATVSTEAPITLQGSSTSIDAFDYCSCNTNSCTTANGVRTCASFPGKSCGASKYAVYTQGTITINGGPTGNTTNGTNLSSSGVTQQNASWPFNVGNMITTYKASSVSPSWAGSCTGTANFTAIPPVYEACGTQTSQVFGTFPGVPAAGQPVNDSAAVPQITYIPGSVQLTSNASGAGVLVVDGDLDIHGGLNFYGLILVRGQVKFTGGGSSGTNLYGAILAGQDVTTTGCTLQPNQTLCDAGDKIGGNVSLQYDVCALKSASILANAPPKLLATHELQY